MSGDAKDVLLCVEGLHKHYGSLRVLRGIDLAVDRGTVAVLIGPSGSGKSTFLRCLNRLEEPSSGHIYIDGVDITGLRKRLPLMRRNFMLPPGFFWNHAGKIEIDPDAHVVEMVRLVFVRFCDLGSVRQVFLWLRSADLKMPVVLRNIDVYKLVWKAPAYHGAIQILHNPLYAGAYAFGRRAQRTRIVDGRARKVSGFEKPQKAWNVLLRDNHAGYISWQDYEDNQRLLLENAYMKKNCARKSARGGRALLTGLMRCGRCGRMMRVFYGQSEGHAHRYQCRGDDAHVGAGMCIGIGGLRIDRAVASQILDAVSGRAVEAALFAADQVDRSRQEIAAAIERELEAARYDASLAARRHELVDPAKRHVAR